MAGIGFELRRLLRRDSYLGLLRAYGYAGIISSGPWILSIIGVMIIGVLSIGVVFPTSLIVQFLVSVTYLMALSMIFTGGLQLLFTRFMADRLFEGARQEIAPNFLGAITVTTLSGGLVAGAGLYFLFEEPIEYRLLMLGNFTALCGIWISVILITSLKEYRMALGIFFVGYSITVAAGLALRPYKVEGLLGGFFIGQAVILFIMIWLVLRSYPAERLVSFSFFRPGKVYYSLAAIGLFYNIGVWADKFVFWANPLTSERIIGPLRASLIYDLPIFLAYLSIMPGMAVFLTRIETDFAERYDAFYSAVREGDTLAHIERARDEMVYTLRQGIYEIFKVQGFTVVALLLTGPAILRSIGISPYYIHLFYVDVTGVGVQVLLLATLNVFYYLDERGCSLFITALFAVLNTLLTAVTQWLDPAFYGYGFAGAGVISSLAGLFLLARKLDRLEYITFMLKRYK